MRTVQTTSPVDASRATLRQPPSQLNLLGQFLAPALGTICHRAELAASLAGTASSVRDLIAYRMGFPPEGSSRDGRSPLPSLARGWRAELVGKVIDDLLEGKKSIRIVNAKDTDPLVFEDVR